MEISEFDLLVQQIVAAAGMSIWLAFPIGIIISVIRQDREAMPPRKIPRPEEFEYFHSRPHYDLKDPFAAVKIGTEKEFEEPKMEDFAQRPVTLEPGPDHGHLGI